MPANAKGNRIGGKAVDLMKKELKKADSVDEYTQD